MAITKYYGILKDFDFNNINKDTFYKLINAGIFDAHELSECYLSETDYFGIETSSHKTEFYTLFFFNKKEYILKNDLKIELIKEQVKKFELAWLLSNFEEYVNEQMLNTLNINQKESILDKIYKEQLAFLKDKTFYLEYQEIKNEGNTSKWFEYLDDELEFGKHKVENDLKHGFIINYLKGESDSKYIFPKEICEIWKSCYLFDKTKTYLETKKNKLLGIENIDIKYNKTISNEELAIFKNDGLQVFNFIVNRHHGKKDTAFFSYLYFYLKDNDKLLLYGNDSIDYRNYITKKFKISYKRIQKTDSRNQYKKNDLFILFDKNKDKFYSNKNEDNLSKNE